MWTQFILEDAHFALNLFAALTMFAAVWLYFDAWSVRKSTKGLIRCIGFLLLSVSFLIHSVFIEASFSGQSLLNPNLHFLLLYITRIPGYIFVILSLFADPLEPRPEYDPQETPVQASFPPQNPSPPVVNRAFLPLFIPVIVPFISAFFAGVVGMQYLKRATTGLERHLKGVAFSFFALAVFEVLSSLSYLRDTQNADIYAIVAPFGPVWILEHLTLLVAVILLGRWVFSYLLSRLQTQLFMFFTLFVLAIFLMTTVSFTALLLKNLQDETLGRLSTDARVLLFAIDSKSEGIMADAGEISQDPQVVQAVSAKTDLTQIAEDLLIAKNLSSLIITDAQGQVLARGEDKNKAGDSLSDDPLVKRALLGKSLSSVVSKDGVFAPEISLRSASPIKNGGTIIGVVVAGIKTDNAFVDGVKKTTGLEASIYGGNSLSATTLVAADGKTRLLGVKEDNPVIKKAVLEEGKNYTGQTSLINVSYFASYIPLKDVDNVPVGMVFVGKPDVSVLQAAGRSIELTFIVSVLLLVLSIFPAYLISRYIARQLE